MSEERQAALSYFQTNFGQDALFFIQYMDEIINGSFITRDIVDGGYVDTTKKSFKMADPSSIEVRENDVVELGAQVVDSFTRHFPPHLRNFLPAPWLCYLNKQVCSLLAHTAGIHMFVGQPEIVPTGEIYHQARPGSIMLLTVSGMPLTLAVADDEMAHYHTFGSFRTCSDIKSLTECGSVSEMLLSGHGDNKTNRMIQAQLEKTFGATLKTVNLSACNPGKVKKMKKTREPASGSGSESGDVSVVKIPKSLKVKYFLQDEYAAGAGGAPTNLIIPTEKAKAAAAKIVAEWSNLLEKQVEVSDKVVFREDLLYYCSMSRVLKTLCKCFDHLENSGETVVNL